MIKNKSLFLLLLIFSVISSIYNYKFFEANIGQRKLQRVIGSGVYDFSQEELSRWSVEYPSLNNTAIPIKSLMGAYYITHDSIIKGIEMLEKGSSENPFIGYEDMLRAKLYESLGEKDSFELYARSANRKLPNSAAHYILLARLYIQEQKIDSLEYYFNTISANTRDEEVWKVYLTTMVTNKKFTDSINVRENATKAKNLFPKNEQIKLSANYVLYGIENVKKSIELRQQAIDSFSNAPSKSIEYLKNALELVPDNIQNYESLIEMLFSQEKYREIINIYTFLNEMELTTLGLPVIEYIGLSYLNLQDVQRGCYLINLLRPYGYEVSESAKLICNQ